jgi:hypothetical protein
MRCTRGLCSEKQFRNWLCLAHYLADEQRKRILTDEQRKRRLKLHNKGR